MSEFKEKILNNKQQQIERVEQPCDHHTRNIINNKENQFTTEDLELVQFASNMEMAQAKTLEQQRKDMLREDFQAAEAAAKMDQVAKEIQAQQCHKAIKSNPRPILSIEVPRLKDQEDQQEQIILLKAEINKLKKQLATKVSASPQTPAQISLSQTSAPASNMLPDLDVIPPRWTRAGRNRGQRYNRHGRGYNRRDNRQKGNVFNFY